MSEDDSEKREAAGEVVEDIIECQICLSLICEPITLTCGHSFCRLCLIQSFRKLKKQCMICRSVCHLFPDSAAENIMIRDIAMKLQPDQYARRLVDSSLEKEKLKSMLPVFSGYNEVIFPGEVLQLYFFEPRYKLMMRRAAQNMQFAYVHKTSIGEEIKGKIAVVAQVVKSRFYPDGQCLIEAKILFPRKLVTDVYEEPETQGLHLATVSDFRDNPLHSSPLIKNLNSGQATTTSSSEIEAAEELSNPIIAAEAKKIRITSSTIALIQHCLHHISSNQASASVRGGGSGFIPFPDMPPSLSASPAPAILTKEEVDVIENYSLAIMARCRATYSQWKEQYLNSQDTVARLLMCQSLLHRNNEYFITSQLKLLREYAHTNIWNIGFAESNAERIRDHFSSFNGDTEPSLSIDSSFESGRSNNSRLAPLLDSESDWDSGSDQEDLQNDGTTAVNN